MVKARGSGVTAPMPSTPPSPSTELVIPLDWVQVSDSIARDSSALPPVTLICGPKNSGKSTFARYLLNTLLQRYKKVGYLDTDVGQPEFSPPGFISLNIIDEIIPDLKTPCLREPVRCFFFGDISSKRDPEAYLACTFNTYDYFVKNYYQHNDVDSSGKCIIPLIINTPGWVKGTGFDVLVDVLRYILPSKMVQMRISAESKNLPSGLFWFTDEQKEHTDMISISSAVQDLSTNSTLIQKDARGLRDCRLFNYFKQCFPSNLNITTNKELAYSLASLPPYEVQLSRIRVVHLHYQVPISEVFHSLNATIVGLAVSTDGSADSQSSTPCVGLGIVRGIDTTKGLLYVITPVPLSRLQKVDLLLQGLIEIPTGLLQVRPYVSPYMSTNVLHKISHKDL